MCTRYEEGTPLDAILLQQGPLPEARLKAILIPLLDGLGHANAHGVWHRDIKPSNILIRDDGSPVLIDFGAARHDVGKGDRWILAQFTPGYAAPEQLWGERSRDPGQIYTALVRPCITRSPESLPRASPAPP
jgi:serine/threonine protein kinase